MHALKVHCGSFLYDNLREQWLSEEERRELRGASSREDTAAMSAAAGQKVEEEEEQGARGKDYSYGPGGGEKESRVGEEEEVEEGMPKEWPLFESPSLTTVRVKSYLDRQGTAYFIVQPTLEGFIWSLEKSYAQFAQLHKALVAKFGLDQSLLPSRKIFGFFGRPKPQQLLEMQEKLDIFLKAVLQKFPVPPMDMLDFCCYPFSDVLSVTQSLALYFFQEGERILAENKAVHISPVQLHCVNRRMLLPMASSGTGSLSDDFGNLLDFLIQLKKLKVAPSTEDTFNLIPNQQLEFELSLLKNMKFLLVDSIDLNNLRERQLLTSQLEGLDIRRCLSSIQEILLIYPSDSSLLPSPSPSPSPASSSSSLDIGRAMLWKNLKTVCFKLNDISYIDKSILLLPNLERLDLSYNNIRKIENLTELPHLEVLDLSHNKISDLSDLHTQIGNISKLGLAHNQLASLQGLTRCFSLQYIDVSYNLISEVTEVYHLSRLQVLQNLHLHGNPIHHSASYRSMVLSQLPALETTICLDSKKASQDELELAASMAGVKGHKRVPSRTADIKPDRDEFLTREAQGEFEESSSVATQLEEMRKTGGEKWLTIFNASRGKEGIPENFNDDVVVRSPKGKKKKTRKHHHHHHHSKPPSHKEKLEGSGDHSCSIPPPLVGRTPIPVEVEDENLSEELLGEIHTFQKEKLLLTDFPVTVLEYAGPLHTLSSQDVDQMLLHSPLEECNMTVDSAIMRVREVVLSTHKTRSQRDLALLEDIRFHEGKKKGVCLRFSQFSGNSLWVIYCVRNTNTLARLYVAIHQALQSTHTPQGSGSVASGTSTPDLLISDEVEAATVGDALLTALRSQLQREGEVEVEGRAKPLKHPLQQSTELSSTVLLPPQSKGQGSGRTSPNTLKSPLTSAQLGLHSPTNSASSSGQVSPSKRSPKPREEREGVRRRGGDKESSSNEQSVISSRELSRGGEEVERRSSPGHQFGQKLSPRQQVKQMLSPGQQVEQRSTETSQRKQAKQRRSPGPQRESSELKESTDGDTTAPDIQPGKPPSQSVIGGIDSRPVKLTMGTRKIIKKPGLERKSLVDFFLGKIAREQKEVLLFVLWGGATLTSAPGCEIEVGLFISDKGIYLLQVMDPEKDPSQGLSWYTENAPLLVSFHAYHLSLVEVKMGIFDQSIMFNCTEKGSIKSLTVYPRTYESMIEVLDNLKAALDACGCTYITTTMQETILAAEKDSMNVRFVNPDMSDIYKLKESLVRPRVVAQICSNAMDHLDQNPLDSFGEDTRKLCEEFAGKFEIVQYVMVSEISSDLLPVSNGSVHFRPRVLILTNCAIYLCSDEVASWPVDESSPISPPFPRYCVLDSYPIDAVAEVEICDKAQAPVSTSDPIYEFRISFQMVCDPHNSSSTSHHSWQLCVYDRQYIDQFFTCLAPLWFDSRQSQLPISHTTEPLTVPAASPTPRRLEHRLRQRRSSGKSNAASYNPVFFQSKALIKFASCTSSERLQFFLKHVSDAQFMKSDEIPLSIFLAYCSVTKQEFSQIEVCVVASQYSIYLLSDVENIRLWLDKGGPSSFSRMALLNKQDASEARCFFRLWIKDIKEIRMGFFYLAMQVIAAKGEQNFTIHSQNTSAMLSLLSAFSISANLRNSFEEKVFDELLSDYIDLAGESLGSKAKQTQSKSVKPNIEFQEPLKESQETLKQVLLCISPSIRKTTTIEQSTSGLQIILGQVMLMIEEMAIGSTHSVQYQLRLVLLSNFGLFVCAHSGGENCSPAVLEPSDLLVKRWCHIDLIDYVEVVSQPRFQLCSGHTISINLKPSLGSDGASLVLAAQNDELLSQFLYYLSLLCYERSDKDKQLTILRV